MKEGKQKKMTPIIIGALCIIVGALIIFVAVRQNPSDKAQHPKTSQSSSSGASMKGLTKNERNHLKLKNKLEHPYQKASAADSQKCQTAIKDAFSYLSSVDGLSNVKPTTEHHLGMTSGVNLTQLAMVIKANGYQFETVEVSKSDNHDVVQFICTLTKSGEDNVYFAGNYNIAADQLGFSQFNGGSHLGGTYG
ncbi:MAG: hypothetical protein ACFNND_06835 [Streptococcus sobrinus]